MHYNMSDQESSLSLKSLFSSHMILDKWTLQTSAKYLDTTCTGDWKHLEYITSTLLTN